MLWIWSTLAPVLLAISCGQWLVAKSRMAVIWSIERRSERLHIWAAAQASSCHLSAIVMGGRLFP